MPRQPIKEPWRRFLIKTKNPYKRPRFRAKLRSYGPTELGLRFQVDTQSGPVGFIHAHPELFATGTTSLDEGFIYWALLKLRGPEGDEGGWFYQSNVAGGRHQQGGAVVDFRIKMGEGMADIGLRVQTPYFHISGGSEKQSTDYEQQFALLDNGLEVVDVYSQNYVNDRTGKAVLRIVENVLNGIPDRSPFYAI